MLPAMKAVGGVAALTIVLVLTGCAGEAEAPTASLTETKGPTQLLRNEASSRIPTCLLYTSPSPRDRQKSRMPSSA